MNTIPDFSLLSVSNQSGEEVTHNEALVIIDAILNKGIDSKAIDTPPDSPIDGDAYIIGSNPTGEFENHTGELVFYINRWIFIIPKKGLTIWAKDEDLLYTYDGLNWIKIG